MHRDIKPSNVLTTVTGKPALTDFGIADFVAVDTSEQTEMALSVPWSAPEVVTKAQTGTVASEIWALAATLYTFAAGHSPFAAQVDPESSDPQKQLVKQIVRAHYFAIRGAVGYGAFDRVLARAMSKKPEDRFASMEEFGQELQGLQRHYGYDVTPLETVQPTWIPEQKRSDTGARGPVVSALEGRVPRAQQRVVAPPAQTESRARSHSWVQRNRRALRIVALTASGTAVVLVGVYLLGRLGGWL